MKIIHATWFHLLTTLIKRKSRKIIKIFPNNRTRRGGGRIVVNKKYFPESFWLNLVFIQQKAEGVEDEEEIDLSEDISWHFLLSPEIFHLQSFSLRCFLFFCVLCKLLRIMSGSFFRSQWKEWWRRDVSILPHLSPTAERSVEKTFPHAAASTWFNKILIYLLMYFNKQLVLHFLCFRFSLIVGREKIMPEPPTTFGI